MVNPAAVEMEVNAVLNPAATHFAHRRIGTGPGSASSPRLRAKLSEGHIQAFFFAARVQLRRNSAVFPAGLAAHWCGKGWGVVVVVERRRGADGLRCASNCLRRSIRCSGTLPSWPACISSRKSSSRFFSVSTRWRTWLALGAAGGCAVPAGARGVDAPTHAGAQGCGDQNSWFKRNRDSRVLRPMTNSFRRQRRRGF